MLPVALKPDPSSTFHRIYAIIYEWQHNIKISPSKIHPKFPQNLWSLWRCDGVLHLPGIRWQLQRLLRDFGSAAAAATAELRLCVSHRILVRGKKKDIAKLALAYSDCLSLRGEDITDITPKFVLGDGDSSIHADIHLYLPTGLLSFINPPCEACPQAVALEMTEGCRVPLHHSGWEELHKSKRCLRLLIF